MIPLSRRAPTMITIPSTSSAFANSEPTTEVCATTTCPSASAKITMNSSGRLPSVDCRTPVTAGPNFTPTCSVAKETIEASAASETRGDDEREHAGRAGVVAEAGAGRREDRDEEGDALAARERGHARH